MTKMSIVVAAVSLSLLVGFSEGYAQAVFPDANGRVLAGVRGFDARAEIRTWLNMSGDQEQFQDNVQAAFELGLRRDGIIVETSAPNYLFCELKMAEASGLVAYSFALTYYSFEAMGVHELLWTQGGIVTVGRNNLTPQSVADSCVDAFANEWLRWNPR